MSSEGGNVEDHRDRGGRTSRGITQDDWDKWRLTRPGLPPDVFQAPQDQIVAIYHDDYWDAVKGDQLPMGVDYAVFDCGVLNGVATAAKILQTHLGVSIDCDIGKNTLSACRRVDRAMLIDEICVDRLRHMRTLPGWPTYGKGWTDRVGRVRADALRMIGAAVSAPVPASGKPLSAGASSDDLANQVLLELKRLEERVSSVKDGPARIPPVAVGSAPGDQAALASWVQQALEIFQSAAAKAQAESLPRRRRRTR